MTRSTDKEDDTYASLLSRATSDAAQKLVADMYVRVTTWERTEGNRKYARGPEAAVSLRSTIERFIGDLLSVRADVESAGRIWRPLKTTAFNDDVVSYRDFRVARTALEALKLIKVADHVTRYMDAFGYKVPLEGKTTRFSASPKLLRAAQQAGVDLASINEHFREELPLQPLVLKREKLKSYYEKRRARPVSIVPTEHTERLAATVKSLNTFLSGFTLGGAIFRGFERVFNECADQATYGWNKGGRLYSVWPISGARPYQQLQGSERARITIDGEPTHEIDIRACNLTIFHAKVGADFDASVDPYERTGLNRDIAKAWTVATFGAGHPITKWSREAVTEYRENTGLSLSKQCTARAAGQKVIAAYPALQELESSGVSWADLMFLESEAVIGAMTALMLQYGAPSFPVHDSLIVRERDISVACDLLQVNFYVHVDAYPWLSIKGAPDVVNDVVRQSLDRYRRPSALDL